MKFFFRQSVIGSVDDGLVGSFTGLNPGIFGYSEWFFLSTKSMLGKWLEMQLAELRVPKIDHQCSFEYLI